MTRREKLMMAVWATVGTAGATQGMAQVVSYGTAGGTYFQDFNSLQAATGTAVTVVTWNDGTTLNGWYAARSPVAGTGPTTQYWASNGTTNSGALSSYGAIADPDRALGTLGSGTPRTQWFGVLLQNTTGSVLDKFTLSYTGEEWRQTTGQQNTLDFYYSTNNAATGGGGTPTIWDADRLNPDTNIWTAVSALSFAAPKFGAGNTDGPIDGNLSENKAAVSGQVNITGGWQPGQYLFLRWRDLDNTGNDQGVAIDDLSFAATAPVVAHNGTTLLANGAKNAATINLGRVVAGNNSHDGAVTLSVTGGASTPYSDLSSDGSSVVPATGTATSAGTAVAVRIGGNAIPLSAIGSDINKTVTIKNEGETNDTNATVPVTAHVVGNRFVDNFDEGTLTGGSQAPVDFGKVLVGATKTVTHVAITTINTGDLSSNTLTTVELPSSAVTGFAGGATSGFATVTMAAGNTVTFDDGSDIEYRDVTLTPIQSGEVVQGTNPGGTRATGFLSIPINQIDTAAGASGDARIYVKGDFYAAAAPVASPTPVAPGGTVTLTNSAPTADSTSGKRLGADILGQTTNQSGWSISGLPTSIGPARAQYVQGGTTFTAVVSTATGTVSFSPAGKLNATYGATISLNMQNDQTQGVHGVAPNDLTGVTQVAVEGTVSDKPANHPGAYSLNGGTMTAGATTLTGSFTQSGGSATIASLVGGGGLTVSGGSLTLGTGAASPADEVGTLSVTGTGKLVLLDRHLAVTNGMSATTLRTAIQAGYNNGSGWAGATSGIALDASDVNGVVGIGYSTGAKVLGPAGGTWFGATVTGASALISKTYYGDANLDGLVNADDLALTDLGFAKNLAAGTAVWTDGDYNYDGVVNSLDYVQIDRSLLFQGSPLAASSIAAHAEIFGEGYAAAVLASVPEPTSLGLIGAGALGLAGRRRRVAK